MPLERVRSAGQRLLRHPPRATSGDLGDSKAVDAAPDDPLVPVVSEAIPEPSPVEGPEVLSVTEFRRRFEAGALSLEMVATFCVKDQALTAELADPCSPEYAAVVMQTWHALTGRSGYRAIDDETFELDDADYLARPWPYCSSDPQEVSRYFGAVAAIIGRVAVQPPARIVEFGAGWGHLSLDLAATGFRVSAVDLNPPSVTLLRRRASLLGIDLEVVEAGFLEFEPEEPVDVFVFFESFHHCEEPFELLDRCTS
ncbi:MAG TPA: class I SAM-dependent methyltransferase, partial [Acidimicrobiales bacterium]|nr:class I SAM-dependent methyltransferase [Acidimicrobiales bacterium]